MDTLVFEAIKVKVTLSQGDSCKKNPSIIRLEARIL